MWKHKPKIKSRVFKYTIHRSSQEVKLSPPATFATDIEGENFVHRRRPGAETGGKISEE